MTGELYYITPRHSNGVLLCQYWYIPPPSLHSRTRFNVRGEDVLG